MLKFSKFNFVNNLQSVNIFDISITLLVSKKLISSIVSKEIHSSNNPDILTTFFVFILFPNLIEVKALHPENILDISLLLEKSKFDISILYNEVQPKNKFCEDITFFVLKLFKFISYKE